MTSSAHPDIPGLLAGLPTHGGLVVPSITPRLSDGRPLFGVQDRATVQWYLTERRCQICKLPFDADPANPRGPRLPAGQVRIVLLLRHSDLPHRHTAEPGLHPWCAAYSRKACPMLAGKMARYRPTVRDLRGEAHHGENADERAGAPAEAWHAVWVRRYDVVDHPGWKSKVASYAGITPLKVTRISEPPGWAEPEKVTEADVDRMRRMVAAMRELFGDDPDDPAGNHDSAGVDEDLR
jgi:hypothetical protein